MFFGRTKLPSGLPSQQKGVALIIAMMISAVIVALSVKASWQFEMGMSRSANGWLKVQQEASLDGIEMAASVIIAQASQNQSAQAASGNQNNANRANLARADTSQSGNSQSGNSQPGTGDQDNLYKLQLLNGALQLDQLDGAVLVAGTVFDAHARFNINNMQAKAQNVTPGATGAKTFTEPQRRFIRLLQLIPLDAENNVLDQFQAIEITEAVIDWLDADANPTGFGGAEGDYYSAFDPPIAIANREMISVSELLLIKGMLPVLYKALLPLVIALPAGTSMNVNTIPVELVQALNEPDILEPQPYALAQDYILDRGDEGSESLQDFQELQSIASLVSNKQDGSINMDTSGLDVKSEYLILKGEVQIGDTPIARSRVLMKRDANGVQILRRTDANF